MPVCGAVVSELEESDVSVLDEVAGVVVVAGEVELVLGVVVGSTLVLGGVGGTLVLGPAVTDAVGATGGMPWEGGSDGVTLDAPGVVTVGTTELVVPALPFRVSDPQPATTSDNSGAAHET